MDIAAGLAATSHAITIAKSIKDAEKALDAATLKAKLADIISELADVKISQSDLIQRVKELEEENDRLRKADIGISELKEENGYLFRQEGNGLIGWPACPSCVSKEKKIVFLVQNGKFDHAKCPSCKSEFAPVISYLTPGYSRADDRNKKAAEANERLAQSYRRLNQDGWLGR